MEYVSSPLHCQDVSAQYTEPLCAACLIRVYQLEIYKYIYHTNVHINKYMGIDTAYNLRDPDYVWNPVPFYFLICCSWCRMYVL